MTGFSARRAVLHLLFLKKYNFKIQFSKGSNLKGQIINSLAYRLIRVKEPVSEVSPFLQKSLIPLEFEQKITKETKIEMR